MKRNVLECDLTRALDEACELVKRRIGARTPQVGIILGSGLGTLAEEVEGAAAIPFAEIPHMRVSTAAGHVGRFVVGDLAGVPVIVSQGRIHGYEGATAQEVAFPVWLMARLGVRTLITTNAAGALNESYRPGDFCIMADHMNLTGRNPLAAQGPANMADRFVGMLDAYDPALRSIALDAAARLGIRAHEGVYVGLLGPSLETPAEIRMLQRLGGDTVAMSVCEEVIAARHVGLRVLGMSLVTNMGCGIGGANPDDAEVREMGASKAADFSALMRAILDRLRS